MSGNQPAPRFDLAVVVLALTCRAIRPRAHGQGDWRRLGLALFAVSVDLGAHE